jgi:hypothetical protein
MLAGYIYQATSGWTFRADCCLRSRRLEFLLTLSHCTVMLGPQKDTINSCSRLAIELPLGQICGYAEKMAGGCNAVGSPVTINPNSGEEIYVPRTHCSVGYCHPRRCDSRSVAAPGFHRPTMRAFSSTQTQSRRFKRVRIMYDDFTWNAC